MCSGDLSSGGAGLARAAHGLLARQLLRAAVVDEQRGRQVAQLAGRPLRPRRVLGETTLRLTVGNMRLILDLCDAIKDTVCRTVTLLTQYPTPSFCNYSLISFSERLCSVPRKYSIFISRFDYSYK